MLIGFLKQWLRRLYYQGLLLPNVHICHSRRIHLIRKRGYANVILFASSLSMWRYQGVYELMKKDKRFHVSILLVPFKDYSPDQGKASINQLRSFFDSRGISYIDTTSTCCSLKHLDPDILFYVQPYGSEYSSEFNSLNFTDRLLCYVPYGVGTLHVTWAINTRFLNLAFRLYYDTAVFRDDAHRFCYNKGRNVIVTGNANADSFLKANIIDVWKPQPSRKKRIIWAPHFSIEQTFELHRGSFMWLYDIMPKIAKDYSSDIQIAFKPHPRLKTVLYKHLGWGKQRTDEYYSLWDNMDNTQLEEGDFQDLFMTSDAMIHDCGSFTAEYLYAKKPVIFTTRVLEENMRLLNDFGLDALHAHYTTDNVQGVLSFIDKVVIEGEDPLLTSREAFFNKYLLPPHGKSVARNILDNLIEAIWPQD